MSHSPVCRFWRRESGGPCGLYRRGSGRRRGPAGKTLRGSGRPIAGTTDYAFGLSRNDVFICNVLKCRPPANRDPEQKEIEACKGYLFDQIGLIQPKVICVLGRHAHNTVFDVDERITKVRGQIREWQGMSVISTFHPSFLLRNESRMKEALEDMENLRHLLEAS